MNMNPNRNIRYSILLEQIILRHFTKDFKELLLQMYFGNAFQSLGHSTLINLNPKKLVLALSINILFDSTILLISIKLDLVL